MKNNLYIIFSLLLLSNTTLLLGQQKDTSIRDSSVFKFPAYTDFYDKNVDLDKTFIYLEHMAEFPGGNRELKKWIGKELKYQKNSGCIFGTVYLRFEVTKTGGIGEIEILKGLDSILDQEVIRVIKILPKFKPGDYFGTNVNVWYPIPVTFKLE